jgi:hypothetical protein
VAIGPSSQVWEFNIYVLITVDCSCCLVQYVQKLATVWMAGVRLPTRASFSRNSPIWKKTPWPESASELYRQSDRRLSAKLAPNIADRMCRSVSTVNLYSSIFAFLDRSRYFFFQVAPQLYSRGWVEPFPDPLFLIKFSSAGNLTRDFWICSQKLWPLDHRGGLLSST